MARGPSCLTGLVALLALLSVANGQLSQECMNFFQSSDFAACSPTQADPCPQACVNIFSNFPQKCLNEIASFSPASAAALEQGLNLYNQYCKTGAPPVDLSPVPQNPLLQQCLEYWQSQQTQDLVTQCANDYVGWTDYNSCPESCKKYITGFSDGCIQALEQYSPGSTQGLQQYLDLCNGKAYSPGPVTPPTSPEASPEPSTSPEASPSPAPPVPSDCSLANLVVPPTVTDVVAIINATGLLDALPSNFTFFLPDNDAVNALLTQVGSLLGQSDISLESILPLIQSTPLISEKLIGALLYHIVPGGAFEPEVLAAEGELHTVLGITDDKYTLQFAAADGSYTITDATGQEVNVVAGPVLACGSAIYVIDKVLLPEQLLSIPQIPVDEAQALLAESA